MKIDTQYLEDHQVKLTVEIDAQPLEDAKHRAARAIAKRVKIPGFRPGKAPYNIVERTVGEAAILEDALDILIKDLYPKVIEEAGVKPYGPGQLENMPSLDPPTFEFVVPLDAELTLGDYKAIRILYELGSIPESEVDRVIHDLRDRQAILEPADRPAQEGDQVFIRLSGKRKQIEEGKDPNLVKDRSYTVVIESEDADTSQEWPFPGFSRHLIDLSVGDEKVISHTFAEDSGYESLRGIEAEFHLIVEEIKSRSLPDLNDEFAQAVGDYETLEALRSTVRTNLEGQAKAEYDDEYNHKIISKIIEEATIKYPPQMLAHEIEIYIDQLENRLAQQNMDMDTYLKMRQIDMDALSQEITPVAQDRLKRSLTLFEVARAENIEVPQKEVEAESMRALSEIGQQLSPDQIRKSITNDVIQGMVGNIAVDMLVKHTLERLQVIAKGESTPQTTDEPEDISVENTVEEIVSETQSIHEDTTHLEPDTSGNDVQEDTNEDEEG